MALEVEEADPLAGVAHLRSQRRQRIRPSGKVRAEVDERNLDDRGVKVCRGLLLEQVHGTGSGSGPFGTIWCRDGR